MVGDEMDDVWLDQGPVTIGPAFSVGRSRQAERASEVRDGKPRRDHGDCTGSLESTTANYCSIGNNVDEIRPDELNGCVRARER